MLTSYQAERQSILDTLAGLGDANDKFSAIALPDYIASGGNIYVTADHFGGSGSLEAKGGPQINITNSSSALLQLGTMNIGGSGGQLIVNDEVMASNQAEAQNRINSTFNTNTSLKAQFASLKSDPASSSNASINIVNKDNATGYTIVNKTDHSTKAYNALLHIQVLKDIINPLGNITINNMANNGNIELSGTADVMAKSVTLKANGSISRAYSAGITHVGGAPEYQYSEIAMYDKENSYINSRANGYRTDDQTQVITNTKGEATIQPGTSTYNDLYNRGSSDGDKLAKQLAAVSVIDRFNDLMGQYQNVSKAYNDMGGDDKYYEYRHDLDNYNSKKARGKFIWAWEKTWAKTAMKKLPTMDSYRSQMSNLWNQISPLYSILDAADHSYLSTDSQTVRNGLAAIQSQVYTRIDSNSSAYIAGLQTHLSQIAAYSSIASDINNRINTAVADVAKEANREKGWVAGGSVYISGKTINVNNKIQSGFDSYDVTVSQAAVNAAKQRGGSTAVVVGGTGGGIMLSPDRTKFIYQPTVKYDPKTDSLITEDLTAGGGKIMLTADKIISTGDGELIARDGTSNFNIINNSTTKLVVGNITNANSEGSITVASNNQANIYTRNKAIHIDNYANYLKALYNDQTPTGVSTVTGAAATQYNPEAGARYYWMTGVKSTYDYYKYWSDWSILGFMGNGKPADQNSSQNIEHSSLKNTSLVKGEYVGNVGANNNDYYKLEAYDILIRSNDPASPYHNESETSKWSWSKFGTVTTRITTEHVDSYQIYQNSVKADMPIAIKFIGSDTTAVNIKGNGDVDLKGSIVNESAKSTVTITSGGTLRQLGAGITSSGVALTANKNIENITITSVGTVGANNVGTDSVSLAAKSNNNGNINIKVDGGTINGSSLPGNVVIKSVDAGTGNVTLQAAGNITGASGQAVHLKGSAVSVTSTNGSIGTNTDNADIAQATKNGSLIVSINSQATSDGTMAAGLSASAKGNIGFMQTAGDLRVGNITSREGDVYISAAGGDIVDALPLTNTTSAQNQEERIQSWKDLGIIAGAGTAETERQARVADFKANAEADFATYTAYKAKVDAYKAANPDVADTDLPAWVTDASFQKMQETYGAYSTVDDYLAANQTYQDMLKTPTYVWSERDMLYALNRDITNPERGSTQSEALQNKKPNISGKNVNIYAQGIGKDSANPEVIMAKGLFDNETNLRRLANVDVSNITTNFATVTKPDGGTEKQIVSFTIDEKIAVGLNATGRLNVKTTGDNAYIAARSNSGASGASSLSVGTVDTNNHDIRLFALAGIQNGLSDLNAANFTGKNLLVEGGAGSNGAIVNIGSHEKPLVVNLTGDIEARTGSSESQTYFNAGRLIRLNVNGSDVGTAENPLDIMANGSAVSVYGADDVYLNGINSNKAGSKLILGDVRPAGQLSVSSETDIQVGRDEFDRVASDGTTVHEDAIPGIVVAKDDLNLTANNVIINGQVGVLSDPADPATVIPGKTVTLIAKKGTVSETEKGQVLTNTLVAQAVKGITMNSEQNVFNAVKFGAYTPGQALDGNVTIKTSSDSLTLANISDTNKPTVDGNIYVENVKDGGTMDVSATLVAHKVVDDLGQVVDGRLGLITLIAKGNVANTGNINSNDDVILRSDYGTVTAAGSINSLGVVSMTGKTGAVAAGSITSGDDKDITIYSETGPVDVSGAITAGKNVTITTSGIAATDETAGVAGDVTVNGSITAKNGKAVINTSLGDVHVAGILSAANGDAAIHTTDGDVGVDGTVTATNGNAEITTTNGNVRIGAAGEANSGTVTGNNVTVTTTAGKMDIHGNVTANTGDVTLGTVYTGTDPANGAISVDGNVTAAQAVAATTNVGNILFDGNVKGTDVTMATNVGTITVTGNTEATTGAVSATTNATDAEKGAINFNGTVTGKTDITATTKSGDITFNQAVTATDNNVTAHTIDGAITFNGNTKAGQNVAAEATNTGTVTFNGDTTAEAGSVTANTVDGAITFNGNTQAAQDVTATATNNGAITVTDGHTVNAGHDVTATAKNGNIDFGGTVTATNLLKATNENGDILFKGSASGADVAMATQSGNISVTGDTTATTGSVTASTATTEAGKGAINFNGTVTGKTDVTATTKSGSITFNNAVTATDNNVAANTIDGAITFNGNTQAGNDVAVQATNTGSVTFNGDTAASHDVTVDTNVGAVTFNGNTDATHDVLVNTNAGDITVTDGHNVNAGHDVVATANTGNIDFGGTVTATNLLKATNEIGDILFKGSASGADVAMATQSGNISVTGDTTATTGSVTASTATTEAGKGAINFNGTVTGKTDVTATTKSGSITFNNAVTATDNNVTANTVDGAIAFNGNTKAGNDVAVNATNTGSITFNGNTDTAHDVTANANLGAVTFNGNTTAANDIGVNTNVGAVTFNGNTAADHDVTVDTNVGAITFNGDTSAARDVVANTNAGSITTTAGHSLKAGNDITATAQDGDISFAGAVQAGENVKATTQNTGNIEFNGAVEAVNKDILAKTNTGNVTVKKDIAANQNINVYTKNGSIVFGGNAENPTKDVYATAKNGSIYLTVDQTGDIKDTHREMNGYSARLRAGQDSPVDNPNVIISQNGIGTVDLAEITAKQAANIRTENGTIHIGHLDGQVVAVVGRDDVSKVVVDQLNAGQQVNIEANDVTIKAMKQLPDSTVPLTVSTMGDAPNKPMSSLVIEDIQTENGVVFPHLWLNTGAITTTKGAMDITKYYVLDKAQISNGNMITNIYGTAPIREPKTMSTYWNDTGINNPLQDMTGWYAAGNNPKWAFIRYENQGNRQIANGHLLSLDEHYYAYNQRYTVEDEMRRMSTPKLQDFYPHYYNPDLAYYNRFESAVITGNPVKVNNAKDDEILIEAAAEVNG